MFFKPYLNDQFYFPQGWLKKKEEKSLSFRCHFFGDISSKRDPKAYLDRIFHLYDYFNKEHRSRELEKSGKPVLPLVINTPGWVKGMLSS